MPNSWNYATCKAHLMNGPIMKFLRFRKKDKEPRPDLADDGKRRQMEALISAAASIQNCTFNGQARRFLTARHGRRVRFPARHLYYEADGMWLTALKLARELGDRKSELEILYLWGRLQHVPPSESILFPRPRFARGTRRHRPRGIGAGRSKRV